MSNSYKLLVLPGDGIGPEVMKEVIKVAKSIGELSKVKFEIEEDDIGGSAYDRYGTPLSDETLEKAKNSHAVLLGAVGGENWDNLDFSLTPTFSPILIILDGMLQTSPFTIICS